MATKSTTKWALIVVAVAGIVVLGFVTVVGLGVYAFVTHVDIERSADPAAAGRAFEEARARFAGQTPLITLSHEGDPGDDRARVNQPAGREPKVPLEALHVLAWDPDDDRLIRLKLPFWLLRLSSEGDFEFDTDEGDAFSLDLTLEDLERHGPGLIVDHAEDGRERVLVWTE